MDKSNLSETPHKLYRPPSVIPPGCPDLQTTTGRLKYLALTGIEMDNFPPETNLYDYLADKINQITQGGVIFVALLDQINQTWNIKSVRGLNRVSQKVLKLVGIDLETLSGEKVPEYLSMIKPGELIEIGLGLSTLSGRNINQKLGESISKMAGVEKIFSMPFAWTQDVFGSISIIKLKNSPPVDKELIEAFVLQFSAFYEKQLAQKLKEESEIKYQKLFDATNVGVSVSTKDGKILEANSAACGIIGYTREELDGFRIKDLYFDFNDRTKLVLLLKSQKQIDNFPVRFVSKSGQVKWINFSLGTITIKNEECYISTLIDITEKVRIDSLIKESEEKYRILAESANDSIFIIDKDFRIEYVNQFGAVFLLSSPSEVIGKSIGELFPPGLAAQYRDSVEEVFNSGEAVQRESLSQVKGENFWQDTILTPIHDDKGKVIKILGIARDVTDLKVVQQKLQRSREDLMSLFDNMSAGFAYHKMVLDENGAPSDYEFLALNNSFKEMTGLSDEVIGRAILEIDPEIKNDPVDWISKYGAVAMTGKSDVFESYNKGLGKWFSINAYSQKPGYFATIFSDITDRKMMEIALGKSEKELRRYMDESPLPVAIVRPSGEVEFLNCNFIKVFGYKKEDVESLDIWWDKAYGDEETKQKVIEKWHQLKEGNNFSGTSYIRCKNGQEKFVEIFVSFIENKILAMFSDQTEKNQLETENRDYRENLEAIVKKRTSELEEKNHELEHLNHLFVGREFRIKELKDKISELEARIK